MSENKETVLPPVQNWLKRIAYILAAAVSLLLLYTAIFGTLPALIQRPIILALFMALVFAGIRQKEPFKNNTLIINLIFFTAALVTSLYLIVNLNEIMDRQGTPTDTDLVMGIIFLITTLEFGRRTVGWVLPALAIIFLFYAFAGPYLPGILAHRGYDIYRVVSAMYLSLLGIYSVPFAVFVNIAFLYIMLSVFLKQAKVDVFFSDIAIAVTGRMVGGPALTAVAGSALMGTVSGSATANVVTTGAFSIPVMRKAGYQSEFAAAVEAVASTGGQIMPPIMGATAFVMAELIGVPYVNIVWAAIIPAVLYFLSLGLIVKFRAHKMGIAAVEENVLSFKDTIYKGYYLFLPFFVLIFSLIVLKSTAMRAGILAIVTTFVIIMVRKETRINLKKFLDLMAESARQAITVAAACALAGIILGVLNLTGLGLRLSDLILTLSSGNVLLILIFTAVVCIILGMGLPTTPAYVTLAVSVAPALTGLGLDVISTHLFIFYFGCLSAITPPTAIASYAAAGLTGDSPFKVGLVAMRLAIVAFFVPFMFVYSPELLGIGNGIDIVIRVLIAVIGTVALAAGVEGWLFIKLPKISSFLLIVTFLVLIPNNLTTRIVGFLILVLALVLGWFLTKKTAAHK